MDAIIERIHEPVERPSRPITPVEELDFEPSEESFHRGVVGRAALLQHGADDAISLAPLDPSRPTVMAASIAMTDRMLAFMQLGCCGIVSVNY